MHVHLIGIGGSGLSAIARLLLESGYEVSGSDRLLSPLAEGLRRDGVPINIGHDPQNIDGADVVVRSSAVPDDNSEVRAALARGVPVLKRADFLGHLMENRRGIAVAGTHGKTTTTAMIAWILVATGQDPSYIIGGVPRNLAVNAHHGQGQAFVIEADEYDRMFLGLRPEIAVVTTIEHDHPDCFPTAEDFRQAFQDFADLLPSEGVLVACADDPGARELLEARSARGANTLSYGTGKNTGTAIDYLARDPQLNGKGGASFDVFKAGRRLAHVSLQIAGRHNLLNALAALAVADVLGLQPEEAARALERFQGTGRRFDLRGEAGGIAVIDDYAHHPTEIRATLAAARDRYPGRQIWAVWQPHTYTRTRLLFEGFKNAFEEADHVIVTEVYAARETPPGDFSARQIVQVMAHPDARFAANLKEASEQLIDRVKPGDVVLVLSAGDADQVSARLLSALRARDTGGDPGGSSGGVSGGVSGSISGGNSDVLQDGHYLVR